MTPQLFNNIRNDVCYQVEYKINSLHSRPFINCRIENSLTVRALYDTGADVNCMSAIAFKKIPSKNQPVKLPDTLSALGSANNGAMKVLGRYRMNVYIAGKDVKTTVLIVNGLNEEFIIGMTLIRAQKLHWNSDSREFGWGSAPLWQKGHGKTRATVKLASLTCTTVPVQMNTECGLVPSSGTACIANIGLIDNPYITRGLYLIQPDKHGIAYVPMFNCAPYNIKLQCNVLVAVIEKVKGCSYEEGNPAYINSQSQKQKQINGS